MVCVRLPAGRTPLMDGMKLVKNYVPRSGKTR
jgi:hypothetical protein